MTDAQNSAFWDRACEAKGHTGYDDWLLHRYDQPVRLALVSRILQRLFPSGMQNTTALDIGCGSGDFIAVLRSQNATVAGADISAAVIGNTAKRFANDPEVRLLTGAILDLDLPRGAFDVITSVTVLQHVVDYEEFVRCIQALSNALRPDGRMIVLELAPPHAAPVDMTDNSGYVYLVERPPQLWQAAFQQAQLRVVEAPVFPQLGIALLRGLAWMIDRTRPSRAQTYTASRSSIMTQGHSTPGALRKLKRSALHAVRCTILFFAWPFDRIFHLPLPPAGFRHYRVWILARSV